MSTYTVIDVQTGEVVAIGDAANLSAARSGAARMRFEVHISNPGELVKWGSEGKTITSFSKEKDADQIGIPLETA